MNSTQRRNILLAVSYAAVLMMGIFLGSKMQHDDPDLENSPFLPFLNGKSEKIGTVLNLIETKYVDSVKTDSLKEAALGQILTHLDPHSAYLPPVDARILNEDLDGNFYGIGIEYYLLNDTLNVAAVNPAGPAFKAGLQRGDQIIKINDKPVVNIGITGKQVVSSIRGKRGTIVDLLVKRPSDSLFKSIRIKRDKIHVSTIAASYLINGRTGYIKLNKFGTETSHDFTAALAALQKQGMKSLILDLRDNGGGYLSAATALADEFLKDKNLIVYTSGAHEDKRSYHATAAGNFEDGDLAILINENSASASEIVAGAIQDLDRGSIIGRRSFGKGLVQEQFDFGDGSALNLTIARYYTPSGRSIQKSYKDGKEQYMEEVHQRYTSGELSTGSARIASNDQKTGFKTTAGRTVYGGGGITPDYFIPADTSGNTKYYEAILSGNMLNQYVYSRLASRLKPASVRQVLEPDFIDEACFRDFVAFAAEKGIPAEKKQVTLSKAMLIKDLKAVVARYYFGDTGFYHVQNADDKAIIKALEIFAK